ncbi:MAG: DUF72 domain-containing protein [Rhizobiales bacterium]|nr:DUF72 domain-containing protein [Hyphomicrobiales bacterium]
MARIRIGTSGWNYESWCGPFFPSGLMVKHQLPYYASQFETTELNGVFYRTPTAHAVESWRDHTGDDFVFAWKASRFITHWKRLSDTSADSVKLLEQRLSLLDGKTGPVQFQLPPNMKADHERLARFLKLLRRKWRYTFEFRHPSWYTPQTMRLLADRNIALCISDHHDAPSPWERTGDFVYVRGHGPGGRYKGHYSPQTLRDWAADFLTWKRRGFDVYAYFDNDQKSAAPADALRLKQLL